MDVSRREFLKFAGLSSIGAIALNACGIPEQELQVQSPVNLPEDLVKGRDNWYATLCRQSNETCGIIVRVVEGRAKKIEGNKDYPLNRGKHMGISEAGLQELYHPDRLARPLIRSGNRGNLLDSNWETASHNIIEKLNQLKKDNNQSSLYIISGPVRGHQRMVVERFAGAFGANYLSYEVLENTVLHQVSKDLFGQNHLPGFDIKDSELILSFGSDFLSTWLTPTKFSLDYGHFRGKTDSHRGKFIQVDSRFSHSAANADLWIPIRPGMEGALALSLAYILIDKYHMGNDNSKKVYSDIDLSEYAPEKIISDLGIPSIKKQEAIDVIFELARELAEKKPAVVLGGGSAAAHTNGYFNLMAIYGLNYLLDSVNKPGGLWFSPESPLKNIENTSKTSSFSEWKTFINRVRYSDPDPVKMIMLIDVDPAYGLPGGVDFGSALTDNTYVVSMSNFMTDSSSLSDVILPINMHLEDWGSDIPEMGVQYPTVGYQQPVVNPSSNIDVKGGWTDLLLTFANQLGGAMKSVLPWSNYKQVIRDSALELFNNYGSKGIGSIKAGTFEEFWTGILQRGGWWNSQNLEFSAVNGPLKGISNWKSPKSSGPSLTEEQSFSLIPFAHITLGDGANAHLPWLQSVPDPISSAVWESWVEINAKRAVELGLKRGDVVELRSKTGSVEVLLYPNPAVPPNVLAAPIGQGHNDKGRYSKGRGSRLLELIDPELNDEETGALAWAATRVWLLKTDRVQDVPRSEGNVPPVEGHKGTIIQIEHI